MLKQRIIVVKTCNLRYTHERCSLILLTWKQATEHELRQRTSYGRAQGTAEHNLRQSTSYDRAQVTTEHKLRQSTSYDRAQITTEHKSWQSTSYGWAWVTTEHKLRQSTSHCRTQVAAEHKLRMPVYIALKCDTVRFGNNTCQRNFTHSFTHELPH